MPANEKISFRDIKKIVLSRIRDKTWEPGSIMPGEVELAEQFGCARATVNRAMRELAEEGIVDRKRKAGTRIKRSPIRKAKFAIPLIRTEIEASGSRYNYVLVSRKIMIAPPWLRARLRLEAQTRVLHLECMHYAANTPFQFEDRWINITAVPEVERADFTEIGPNEWLVNQVPFTDVELSFTAIGADEKLAGFLSIAIAEPVFSAERITWLDKLPVTYAKMSFARGYRMTTRF